MESDGFVQDVVPKRRAKIGRHGVLAAVLGLGVLAFGASSSAAAPSGTLRVGVTAGGSTTVDPDAANTGGVRAHYTRLYAQHDSLFRTYNGKIEMSLAERARSRSGGRVWDVTLRRGIRFHNGRAVTPEDVIFSMARHAKKGTRYASELAFVQSVRKTGPRSVRFTLKEPRGTFVQDMGAPNPTTIILPRGYNPRRSIGAGPFVLKGFDPGRKTTFEANTRYWRGAPSIKRLEIYEFKDNTARVNALLAGQIDATEELSGAQVRTIRARRGLTVLSGPSDASPIFTMNTSIAPFNDVRVRQAMKLIIDRPAMVRQAVGGLGTVANDVFARFDPCYAGEKLPQRRQDINRARALLRAAGQQNLTVTLNAAPIAAGALEMSQVLVEQAKRAGVTINIKQIDPSTYFTPASGYQSWAFGLTTGGGSNYLRAVTFLTGPQPFFNETHFRNERYWRLLAQARRTVNEKRRCELVEQMQRIDRNEGGYIVPFWGATVSAFSSKVKGIRRTNDAFGLNNMHFDKVRVTS